jgi:hypothetical protein
VPGFLVFVIEASRGRRRRKRERESGEREKASSGIMPGVLWDDVAARQSAGR